MFERFLDAELSEKYNRLSPGCRPTVVGEHSVAALSGLKTFGRAESWRRQNRIPNESIRCHPRVDQIIGRGSEGLDGRHRVESRTSRDAD